MEPTASTFQERRGTQVRAVTMWSAAANLGLSLLKLVCGLVFGSKVLLADAAHSLSDLIGDAGLMYSERLWRQPCDDEHPYGHGKIESLSGLGIGLLLFSVAGGIIWDAVSTLDMPPEREASLLTLAAAVLSIVVKEWLFRWTARVAHAVRSEAMLANAWHHRSDALTSVVAAVSIAVDMAWDGSRLVDNLGALVIAVILIHAAGRICWGALNRLIDQAPPETLREEIIASAREVDGVITAHAMRTRYVGAEVYIDLHIDVLPDLTVRAGHDIAHQVSEKIRARFPEVADVVVHVEPYQPGVPAP